MPKILQVPHLAEFPGLIHGFTTRELGYDFDRLSQEIKVLPSQIYTLKQIHSNKVVYLSNGMDLAHLPEGDALVTDRKDVVIGIKTADCVPLLVYDSKQGVVGAIHAGHKGLADGIIQKTLSLMTEQLGCHFENIFVAMGPCISVDNYEVGQELIDKFTAIYAERAAYKQEANQKSYFDLKQTTLNVLVDCGVDDLHTMDLKACTYARDDLFYSYRREASTGRNFSFIGMVS